MQTAQEQHLQPQNTAAGFSFASGKERDKTFLSFKVTWTK